MSLQNVIALAMFGCFVVAGFLIAIWLGFALLGVVFLILGLAVADGEGLTWRRRDRS